MSNILLTVVITARNEIYLQKTIDNVLENIEGDTEIIAILDGYWPDPPIKDHPKVKLIHHSEAIGQRQSINEAMKIARGEFMMKLDAHCAVDKGFDVKLAQDCEYDWTVIPRMYNLDIETWQPKIRKRTDYMYMGWNDKNELRSLYYSGNLYRELHRNETLIDDTMGCMGPGWFMRTDRFWELGGCDERHGGWGQQGVEVAMKAWLSGGSLKVNKKTWFAHWFRGHIGFPYPISGKEVNIARKHSMDLWLNNKWEKQVRDVKWLLDKFNPPGWENYNKQMDIKVSMDTNISQEKINEISGVLYEYHFPQSRNGVRAMWKDVPVLKMPSDLILYSQVIHESKPEIIIETGTKYGGSALYMQDMLDMNGNGGKVITVDIRDLVKDKDPRITYISGNSNDPLVVEKIKEMAKGKRVMVVLDGNHHRIHVKWELRYYSPLVSPGCYLVIEDCYYRNGLLYHPGEARDAFLKNNKNFVLTDIDKRFLIGLNVGGWLKRNG